jgi:curved DNA-binding protein CbpA
MSREDAYRVLGLKPGASEAAIKEAYHRLIASVHPDRGGSSFLAAQVNRAKDVLLGGKWSR